jgi:hypothetical protein
MPKKQAAKSYLQSCELQRLSQKGVCDLQMKFGLIGTSESRTNQLWRQNFTVFREVKLPTA